MDQALHFGYSLRVTQNADGIETDETRYYILRRYLSGKRFSEAVRGHWAIESMQLGIGCELPWGGDGQPHTRTNAWQQSELVKTLRGEPAEASSSPKRQPSRQDDSVQSQQ